MAASLMVGPPLASFSKTSKTAHKTSNSTNGQIKCVQRPLEEIYNIRVEKNVSKQRLTELGVSKWSTWKTGKCNVPWDWHVDQLVYIEEGEVRVVPEGSERYMSFVAGDLHPHRLVTCPRGMAGRGLGLGWVWQIVKKIIQKEQTNKSKPTSMSPRPTPGLKAKPQGPRPNPSPPGMVPWAFSPNPRPNLRPIPHGLRFTGRVFSHMQHNWLNMTTKL
ncbi:putative rmlC-like jelly roll protein [Helianthus anomalus]